VDSPGEPVRYRCLRGLEAPKVLKGSGRGGLLAVLRDEVTRRSVDEQVGGPVRSDGRAVRQEFPGVLEDNDAIAE
jgi:hypothetical protein